MYKVTINPHWEISHDAAAPLDTAALLGLLKSIQTSGSIAQAAQQVGLSYRYAWGLLREAEKLFGNSLMTTGRGRGTSLTPLADKLIWADRRIAARLSPTLESLASELENELGKITAERPRAIRLDASHGFSVELFLNRLNGAQLPIELRYRNSTDAVAALSRGECSLAGFPVPLGEFERPTLAWYTRWLNRKEHCLIHLSTRNLGLFVAAGNPKRVKGLRDLLKPDVHFVNRHAGSGTRMLLELMLAKAQVPTNRINGFQTEEFTHSAAAAYIASGMADAGIGVQTAADLFGLGFIPLVRERYFLALSTASLRTPLMRQVIDILQSASFRDSVDRIVGYDAADTGKILSLTQAFGPKVK